MRTLLVGLCKRGFSVRPTGSLSVWPMGSYRVKPFYFLTSSCYFTLIQLTNFIEDSYNPTIITTFDAMTNNDVIRRLRYTFDYSDDQMIELFSLGNITATRAQVSDWLKKDEAEQVKLMDVDLAGFLNGMIVKNRGKKDGLVMENERQLNNNIVFRKLRIALNFKDTDIIKVYDEVGMIISKHELSAIFRKPGQRQYRACLDQFLRNFMMGLQLRERGNKDEEIA